MSVRVEHIGDATLYLGDCREILPSLPLGGAVVSDPPYGVGYSHGVGGGKLARSTQFDHHPIHGDDAPFDPIPWLRFPVVVLFGGNHFANRLPPSPNWLIWDKRDSVCSNDQADCEMAWTNLTGPARLTRHLWNGMLKASEKGEVRVHPTQKPVAVMRWVIEQATAREHVIIDPYMGSGTTGVACAQLGRRFIGIEIEPKYFDIACRRIEQATRQSDLFIERPARPVQDALPLTATDGCVSDGKAPNTESYPETQPLTESELTADSVGSYLDCVRAIGEQHRSGRPLPPSMLSRKGRP